MPPVRDCQAALPGGGEEAELRLQGKYNQLKGTDSSQLSSTGHSGLGRPRQHLITWLEGENLYLLPLPFRLTFVLGGSAFPQGSGTPFFQS